MKITPMNLVGPVKKRVGFSGITAGDCTQPWSRLERVGREKIGIENKSQADHVDLLIRQGGIMDDKEGERLSRYYKTIFREDVFPAIKKFAPDCGNVFRLTLHFNQNELRLVDLVDLEK